MNDQAGSVKAGNPGDGDAAAAAAAAAAAGKGSGEVAPWYGKDVAPEIKGFLEVKGWDKDPLGPVKGYQQLEGLLGADKAGRAIVVPKDANDKDGWNAVFDKLGRPGKPEDYQLPVPEGDDGAFAKAFSPILHEAGISKQQAQVLATKFNEYQAQQIATLDAKAAQAIQAEETALKLEWGGQHDANIALGQRAALALGIEQADIDGIEAALGYGRTMKLFQSIGSKLGEDSFTGGEGGKGQVRTVEGARAKLQALQNDAAWVKRWTEGDVAAAAEKDELDRIIASAASKAA